MDTNKQIELEQILKQVGIGEDEFINQFHNVNSLVESYSDYTNDIEKKKINFGFPKLNEIIRGLRVQELLTIVAGTGIGKSALALNFLLNFVKNTKELTVLFSLEMSTVGIAERIFQIELDRFGFEIENEFTKKNKNLIEDCKKLENPLNNFVIITDRVEVHKIPYYIKAIELLNKGRKVRLVAIDYVGLMDNINFPKDEYLRTTDNMKLLYSYAKKLDVAIINLSQTSRLDVKGNNNGLGLYSGKGSGEVENSSDFFLTLERVDSANDNEKEMYLTIADYNNKLQEQSRFHTEKLDLLRLSIHKNRRGKTGITYATFNRKNLRIKEYDEEDFNILKM